jgi:hypothetical protein
VSLVLNDGTGFIPLQLEHPLKGDRAATFPLQIAAPTRVKSSELGLRGTVTLPVRLNMCCCVGAEVGLGRWGLGGCGWPWAEPDPYYNPRVKNKICIRTRLGSGWIWVRPTGVKLHPRLHLSS